MRLNMFVHFKCTEERWGRNGCSSWLVGMKQTLNPGETVLSVITSGDIDAVYIQLHALSTMWERDDNVILEVFIHTCKACLRPQIFQIKIVTINVEHLSYKYFKDCWIQLLDTWTASEYTWEINVIVKYCSWNMSQCKMFEVWHGLLCLVEIM